VGATDHADPRSWLILQGGKQLSLKQTRQRDEVVTWLSLKQERVFQRSLASCSVTGFALVRTPKLRHSTKGVSETAKVLSFHEETVVLLKRYFDQEAVSF